MTPAPGKKRGRKPLAQTKVRVTVTMDPNVKSAADAVTTNFSLMVEDLVRKELKRLKKRVGPGEGPRA
jgi:hypothetical protein